MGSGGQGGGEGAGQRGGGEESGEVGLRLFNTEGRVKRLFRPQDKRRVVLDAFDTATRKNVRTSLCSVCLVPSVVSSRRRGRLQKASGKHRR